MILNVKKQWIAVWFCVTTSQAKGNKATIPKIIIVIPQSQFRAFIKHIIIEITAAIAIITNPISYRTESYCENTAAIVLDIPLNAEL